jgi:hypothetical protein
MNGDADPKLVVSSSGQKEEECPEGLDSRLGDRAVARSDSTPIDTQQPNPGDEKDPQEENSEDALEEIQNDWGALEKGNKDGDQQEIQEIQERDYKRGEKSSIKDLYKTSKSACPCCITWDDEKPYKEDAEKAAKAKSEREKYAIVHKQEAHGGESGWKTFAIDINSPILKDRLTTAFADYPAADMSALDISFLPPFLPFVHRWTALVEVEEKEKENIALKHLALLRQIVEPELENAMRAMKHLNYSGYITFEDIVFAFIPGDVLVKSTSKSMSAGILRKVTKNEFHGKKYYTLEINVVDWNGFTTGVRTATWFLDEFSGSCKLTQLDIFPLTRHSQQKSIRERLLEQGARFEQLRGQHFKTYNGHATYKRTFDHLLYGTQEREARKPVSHASYSRLEATLMCSRFPRE